MNRTEEYQALRQEGLSYRAIGRRYGLTGAAIHAAIKKRSNPLSLYRPKVNPLRKPNLTKGIIDSLALVVRELPQGLESPEYQTGLDYIARLVGYCQAEGYKARRVKINNQVAKSKAKRKDSLG